MKCSGADSPCPLRCARRGGSRRYFYTLNQAEPTLKLWRNLGLPI